MTLQGFFILPQFATILAFETFIGGMAFLVSFELGTRLGQVIAPFEVALIFTQVNILVLYQRKSSLADLLTVLPAALERLVRVDVHVIAQVDWASAHLTTASK